MTAGFIYKKLIRLLKGIVLLYMTSQFEQYCTVNSQISIPKTRQEYNDELPPDLRRLNCNRKFISQDEECAVQRKPRRQGRRSSKKRNSGLDQLNLDKKEKIRQRQKCRCRRPKKLRDSDRAGRRAQLDDHHGLSTANFNYPPPRPRMKICRDSRCLTFTNSRRSFNAPEYLIVSHSNYIEVVEGAWELCGEFENVLSCVIMGDNNYLDIFADESVRVTMLRKLELPDELPDFPEMALHEDIPRAVSEEMEDMEDDLEDSVLEKSNQLLSLDRHKRPHMRKKFSRVLDTLGDT